MQVVFIHPFLCFQSSFGDGQTYLRGLFEYKGLVIPTTRMLKYWCVENVVLYYKMTSLYNGYGRPSLKYYNVIEKGYEQNSLNKKSLIDAREFSIKNSRPTTYTSQRWKD